MTRHLPATVLSRFPGEGKTTPLNHVFSNRDGRRVAVIVNDMSDVNIDASLVARLDTTVTVVDVAGFLRHFRPTDSLEDRGEIARADNVRVLSALLIERVEFAQGPDRGRDLIDPLPQ